MKERCKLCGGEFKRSYRTIQKEEGGKPKNVAILKCNKCKKIVWGFKL